MALAHRGVFRIGPHGQQALAWEVLSDGGPAIVEKYGGLNNASAYIGMMPGHSLGIVIRGSIPTKSAAAFCWTSPASNTQAAAARHAERAATVGERQDRPPQVCSIAAVMYPAPLSFAAYQDQENHMPKATVPLAIATLFALQSLLAFTSAAAQEAMEKKSYNYSAWTPGIFSEAVTITNMGKGKFIFLAGVGAEDENGPRGKIRHAGDFGAQCAYAYDKIKRALAANGSSLKDAVKMTVYVTDMRHRLDWAKCSGEAFAGATVPAQTLLGISQLAFPEMMVEIDVTAVSHE